MSLRKSLAIVAGWTAVAAALWVSLIMAGCTGDGPWTGGSPTPTVPPPANLCLTRNAGIQSWLDANCSRGIAQCVAGEVLPTLVVLQPMNAAVSIAQQGANENVDVRDWPTQWAAGCNYRYPPWCGQNYCPPEQE